MASLQEDFQALNTKQQGFVKACILKQIINRGYVCAHDLADYVRYDLLENAPKGFDWSLVTQHTQAGCWDLEAQRIITRQEEGLHTTLRMAKAQ